MTTYKIVRHYHPHYSIWKPKKTMKKGLTLKQAQKHCQDRSTRKEGVYFDGYEEE